MTATSSACSLSYPREREDQTRSRGVVIVVFFWSTTLTLPGHKDASHGNYAAAALDIIGGLSGGVSLIAARYATWLADAADGSNALLRASPDLQSGFSWSAEGLGLTQRAGFWGGVSGVSGAFATLNGLAALTIPGLETGLSSSGRCR